MRREVLKTLLEIMQVVEIISKCGLSSNMAIKKMPDMAWRNGTNVDVVNNIPIREDCRNKRDQTSKYTILNNCSHYVHHDLAKNQKLRGKVAVILPPYGHEGCGLKLVMQTFIYKLLSRKKRRGVEVEFYVIWSTIQVGKEKLNLIQNPKEESRNKVLSGFLITFKAVSSSFKEHWLICHCQGD